MILSPSLRADPPLGSGAVAPGKGVSKGVRLVYREPAVTGRFLPGRFLTSPPVTVSPQEN